MSWTYIPPDDDHDQPLHSEEEHLVILPLDETGELFTTQQAILSGPNGESRTVTKRALHVAGCNHLVGYSVGDLLGRCDLCSRWLCERCQNLVRCRSCLQRLCTESCTKLLDDIAYCPSCRRTEKLKRAANSLHGFLKREF